MASKPKLICVDYIQRKKERTCAVSSGDVDKTRSLTTARKMIGDMSKSCKFLIEKELNSASTEMY